MDIHLIAVGARVPAWVEQGYADYAKRLPAQCRLNLIEIPAEKRGKNADLARLVRAEGERCLRAIPAGAHVIALERTGRSKNSEEVAQSLARWMQAGRDTALLIGGPEGLDAACLARADEAWSLSALTLPHALVRVLVAEQLYRAWSLINGMPYHR